MTCQEVMEYMQRHLDGDLDEFETEILMKHTRHCPDCSAMFERLKSLSNDLESLPKVTPSYSLVDSIMPELKRIELMTPDEALEHTSAEEVGYGPRSRIRKRWTRRLSFRALSGVIAAGVVVGLFLVTYHPDSLKNTSNSLAFDASAGSSADTGSQDSAASNEPADKKSATALNAPKSSSANQSNEDRAADKAPATGNTPASDRQTESAKAPAGADQPKPGGGNESADSTSLKAGSPQQPDGPVEYQSDKVTKAPSKQNDAVNGQTFGAASEGSETGGAPDQNKSPVSSRGTNQSLSPSGDYDAVASDTKITIYDAAAGGVLYEKNNDGAVRIAAWSKDSSTLEYAVQAADGSEKRFVIDVAKGTETEQQ